MATDRLKIYNGALRICKERALASLTESREPRFLLDQVWQDNGILWVLEQAQWKFAMRSARIDYSASIAPDWGFRRAFPKPDDWVSSCAMCADEYMRVPITMYRDEVGTWFADLDQLFVSYVSDDAGYGLNLAAWPQTFNDAVQGHFAEMIVGKLADATAERIDQVEKRAKALLRTAKNKDAKNGPPLFPPEGAWIRSRRGGSRRGNRNDGGPTGNLIG